jgi:hypothetical protein
MRGYKHRIGMVKDENGNLLADTKKSLNVWKSYFSQLLDVQGISNARLVKIHPAEPFEPERSLGKLNLLLKS